MADDMDRWYISKNYKNLTQAGNKAKTDVEQIMAGLGLRGGYDPLEIAEATGGRTAEDDMYLTFRTFPKEVQLNAPH